MTKQNQVHKKIQFQATTVKKSLSPSQSLKQKSQQKTIDSVLKTNKHCPHPFCQENINTGWKNRKEKRKFKKKNTAKPRASTLAVSTRQRLKLCDSTDHRLRNVCISVALRSYWSKHLLCLMNRVVGDLERLCRLIRYCFILFRLLLILN